MEVSKKSFYSGSLSSGYFQRNIYSFENKIRFQKIQLTAVIDQTSFYYRLLAAAEQ